MSFKYKLFPFQASLIFLKKCNYFTVMLYWPQQWPQRVLPLVLLEPAQVVEQPQQPQPRHHRSLLWRTRLLQLLREFLLICRIRTGEWILIYEIFQNCIIFTIFFFAEPSQQWPIRLTVPRIALRWWKLWLPCLSEEAVGVLLIIPTKIKINLHQRTSANPLNSNNNNSSNCLRLRFQPQ